MGQYYKPILLDKTKTKPLFFAYSHDFDSGLKLMEHSWMKNKFVGIIEKVLINQPMPIVWAGDYADNEPFNSISKNVLDEFIKDGGDLEGAKKDGIDLYSIAEYIGTKITHNVYISNYGEKRTASEIHDKIPTTPKKFKYIVNYDKKLFVNKSKVQKDDDGCQIHPLPLLTCEGNGRGGGDYHKDNELVGSWARDIIGIHSRKSEFPKDFKEIEFDLVE